MSEYSKQLPEITPANKPFWDAAKRHELTAYRCLNCGTFYSQVTDCLACDSPRMQWVKVSGKGSAYRRILDMGVVSGAQVEVERVAPLGDPIQIKIKGYKLSLRKGEAANIQVEVSEV